MKNLHRHLFLGIIGIACLAPCVYSQVAMDLTGVGNNVLGGVYVGPYYGTVGTQTNVPIICDDFADASSVGETWTATVTTVGSNAPTMLSTRLGLSAAQQSKDYGEAAYLAQQLMSGATCPPGIRSCGSADYTGDIQFAIWQIFDPGGSPLSSLSGNDYTNATNWLHYAAAIAPSSSSFAGVTVYSPVGGGPPQEFLGMPEADSPFFWAIDLAGLAALFLFARHRTRTPAVVRV